MNLIRPCGVNYCPSPFRPPAFSLKTGFSHRSSVAKRLELNQVNAAGASYAGSTNLIVELTPGFNPLAEWQSAPPPEPFQRFLRLLRVSSQFADTTLEFQALLDYV
jgi:hypothetical protein